MRKQLSITLILLLVCLTGCSNIGKASLLDEYSWGMTTIQSKDGSVLAYADGSAEIYKDAAKVIVTCEAKNGNFTITDLSNSQSYMGQYNVTQTTPQSTLYKITIGGMEGHAVSSMTTTYLDGKQNPTFIISIADYTLNFQASSEATKK